jgi:hypothetical protein
VWAAYKEYVIAFQELGDPWDPGSLWIQRVTDLDCTFILFSAVLQFELGTSHLLGRCSVT